MTNSTNLYLQEILDKPRLEILDNLKIIKQKGFILGGGTGLALILGHRESIDFDFFINQDIDTNRLFQNCKRIFKDFKIIKQQEETNTLSIGVYNQDKKIKISFFTYKHKNLKKTIQTEYFNIYSINDIGAMKLRAIQKRATNKDYIDIYKIIEKIGLKQLLLDFQNKFGQVISEQYLLKSLIYFEDIKKEDITILEKGLTFSKTQKELENIVRQYMNQ